LSLLKLPWGASSVPEAILAWRRLDVPSAAFFETDRRATTTTYEDLMRNPQRELRRLCEFIGEEFDPGMLDTSQSVDHVNPANEPWKQKVGRALDPSRVAVWRQETTLEQRCEAEAIAGDRFKAYGYPTSFEFDRYIQVLNLAVLERFPALIDRLLDGHTRFWEAHPREAPAMRLFLGDPCLGGWMGSRRRERIAHVTRVAACAARSRAAGIPLIWLGAPPAAEIRSWSPLCRSIASVLPHRLDIDAFLEGQAEPSGRRL
jgi:hypothetical protein